MMRIPPLARVSRSEKADARTQMYTNLPAWVVLKFNPVVLSNTSPSTVTPEALTEMQFEPWAKKSGSMAVLSAPEPKKPQPVVVSAREMSVNSVVTVKAIED